MRYTLFLLNVATPNYTKLSRATPNYTKLSRSWVGGFLPSSSTTSPTDYASTTQNAIQRTLPLLFEDPTSVPFICRYRSDVISPLTTKQIHQLSATVQKYESLSNLRNKILDKLQQANGSGSDDHHSRIILRVETSISKSELDDIYLPYKPASKGSLEDRIKDEYPQLVTKVDELWNNNKASLNNKNIDMKQLRPIDKATTLLANRIASDVSVMDSLLAYCKRYCRVHVKQAVLGGDGKKKKAKGAGNSKHSSSSSSFETYYDYSNKLNSLRDHQVLAIRRGIDQKQLKVGFDLDDERIDRIIEQAVFSKKQNHQLFINARKDAWSRLLKKRVTSRLWKDISKRAEEQSIHVFCDNLSKALLAPPPTLEYKTLLALDPGFQAGIKCAILLAEGGNVISLDTIKFLGNAKESGKKKLSSLLEQVKTPAASGNSSKALIVLGNGHGTREARTLLQEAAGNIEVDVKLVTEAGASVWSVTEMAKDEFPDESPAAIAAVSIGRRFLNPLNELVKIPPKSLGLGMYQHDLSEKILDEKLSLTSIDAVAEVGVDLNTCSSAILTKVPSLTKKLCDKIIKARPLKSRDALLTISGLGKQTYNNCAAFVRVSSGSGGSEALDSTLVHPEAYDLAKWLLKELQWKLSDASSIKATNNEQQKEEWSVVAKKASNKFDVTPDRCMTVIDHLFFSITSPDPRLRSGTTEPKDTVSKIGSTTGCSSLPNSASTIEKLCESQLPLRNIVATVRNVVDFGVFVDIGLEQNGLLHRSKMGNVQLSSLMVGQEIGIDILGVASASKISVGLARLGLPADDRDNKKRQLKPDAKKPSAKNQRKGR